MSDSTDGPSWVTLTPNDRVVWSGHPSLRAALWTLGSRLLLIGLGIGGVIVFSFIIDTPILLALSFVPIGAGLLSIAMLFLRRWSVQYVLTTEEIYRRRGLLSRSVINLPINHIQNTAYTQSFLERLLSYGTIRIDTAGEEGPEIILQNVKDPEQVDALLTEQLDAVSAQSTGQTTPGGV